MRTTTSPIVNALPQFQKPEQHSLTNPSNPAILTPPCEENPRYESQSRAHNERAKKFVLPVRVPAFIAQWMTEEVVRSETDKRIATKNIAQFSQHFVGSKSGKCMRSKRLWEYRDDLVSSI